MSEFNLSKKLYEEDESIGEAIRDVKEFIKRLKEEFTEYDEYDKRSFVKAIDKLAGSKLSGANEK